MDDSHTQTVSAVLKYFDVDESKGLSLEDVQKGQKKFGPNGKSLFVLTPFEIEHFNEARELQLS